MRTELEQTPQRVVIIANGPLPDLQLARRHIHPGDRLICADGGAHHARAMGLRPDVVVGDFDSINPELRAELEAAGVRFEAHPVDKDQTDLELALQLAVDEGAHLIDILAVQGGRLDQSLANLMLLARPEWAAAQVRAIAGHEIAWPLRSGESIIIEGKAGDRVSLVPLALTAGVTFEGVKWPLREATLPLGSTWGISNVITDPPARLRIEKGLLLVVHAIFEGG